MLGQKSAVQKISSAHHDHKKTLSPLKRFNRVVPSAGKPAPSANLKLAADEHSPLKSNSASLLEEKASSSSGKKERPDSAPLKKEDKRQQVPIEARVIIVSHNETGKKIFKCKFSQ